MRSNLKPVPVEQLKPGTPISWRIRHIGYSEICVPKLAVEVRLVPEADWTDEERIARRKPSYLTITDLDGKHEAHYRVPGGYAFGMLGEHYSVCARCGQLAPCEEQVLDSEMLLQRHTMENQCCVCQKRLGSRRGEVVVQTPDGPTVQRYHTTKRSRCRRAYTLAIARDPEALERLRAEDEGRPYFPAKKPADGEWRA